MRKNKPATEKTAAHFDSALTRTDCIRDNKGVYLDHLLYVSYGATTAKRGRFIGFSREGHSTGEMPHHIGRVVGRVTCEGVVYVEVAEYVPGHDTLFIRWVKPECVTFCRHDVPRKALSFLMGGWSDGAAVCGEIASGRLNPLAADKTEA